MDHEGRPSLQEISILKVGRHFRCGEARVVVGRNEKENQFLEALSKKTGIPYMSVRQYMGPITIIMGDVDEETIQKSAEITVRYSDAPTNLSVDVIYSSSSEAPLSVAAIDVGELDSLRI
jgi:predicted ribosome quality control (RQC) complex YloA/Tae2 family protein